MQSLSVENIPVRVPENLDVDSLLEHHPPDFNANPDKIKFVIDLLINRMSWDKRSYEGKHLQFIELHSDQLRLYIHDYQYYLRYLIRAGVFMVSPHGYSKGNYSKSYQLTEKYWTKTKDEFIRDIIFIKAIYQKTENENRPVIEGYPYLMKWMDGIRINSSLSRRWAEWYLTDALSSSHTEVTRQKAYFKHANALQAVQRISRGYHRCVIDNSGHRLHTVLTNVKSDLRNAITYKGKPIISTDLSSSQVYLLNALRTPEFYWTPDKSSKLITSACLATNVASMLARVTDKIIINMNGDRLDSIVPFPMSGKETVSYMSGNEDYSYMSGNELEQCFLSQGPIDKGQDWNKFREQVELGTFYEYMLDETRKLGDEGKGLNGAKGNITRSYMKKIIFTVLFSKNNSSSLKAKYHKDIFQRLFPNVFFLTQLIKAKDHSTLALVLQNIESELFLNRISKRISCERPDIPIFTIHDSICTTSGNEEFVAEIMTDELFNAIGVKPSLKTEYWREEKLEKQINPCFY